MVYNTLNPSRAMPISEILELPEIHFGRSKVTKILKALEDKELVEVEGNGRGTKYHR